MEGFKSLPKMQCFKEGGHAKPKAMCYGGKMKEGGKADIAQDKKVVKKAFAMHDKQEHPGEKTDLSKLKKGGRMKKDCGTVRKYKAGGSVTNVYEAKKKAGDKDNIKNVKQITPTKANASSAASKGGNTVAKYNGEDGSHVTLKESEQQPFGGTNSKMGAQLTAIAKAKKNESDSSNPYSGADSKMGAQLTAISKAKKLNMGGSLKDVDSEDNPSLAKLPTNVRNKMGYKKSGGKAC
jgi:hypothetical protein